MQIALVIGGSRGLGKIMSLRIAAKGNDVVLTYDSNKADAEEVVKPIETICSTPPPIFARCRLTSQISLPRAPLPEASTYYTHRPSN
jgi:NAD(P)-dependent dehydrogenase (short-subunit alcohol dehydrogenase family)